MKNHRLVGRAATSLCLVISLLLQETLPHVVAAGSTKQEASLFEEQEREQEKEPEILAEITENRGEFSKEYLLSDNSTQVVVYPEQIHYQNGDGNFVEIDNSLIETEDGYVNANNSFDLFITDNDESKGEVIFKEEDYEISWTIVEEGKTENPAPENIEASITEETVVTFEGYESGISVEYAPTGDGVKENILIPGPECGNQYSFFVQTKGLIAELASNNEINFIDKESGEVQYYFPAPYMIDAEGAASYKARYEIVTEEMTELEEPEEQEEQPATTDGEDEVDYNRLYEGDQLLIRIVIEEDWFENAAFPVILDPVLKQNKTKNLLDYGCVSSDGNIYDTLYAGRNSSGTFRSYVKFELPKLPPNSVISEAMLYLDGTAGEEDTHYIVAKLVDEEWYNKSENDGKALSWDSQPKISDELDYSIVGGKFDLTKAVRMWKSGQHENYGIVFTAYNETTKTRGTIKFANKSTEAYFKITYRTMNGLESYWGTHAISAGTAGKGYINDYTGALTMVNTEVATAGERMPLALTHVYNSNTNIWQFNYQQKLRIPISSTDISTYPYLYLDGDGTEHYFKKQEVTYLKNGVEKIATKDTLIPPAGDEDGLNLYVVPVTEAALSTHYPYKLIDKSASTVYYFDYYGRLGMITDSNQFENGGNKATKEQNRILITYRDNEVVSDEAVNHVRELADTFKTVCNNTTIEIGGTDYLTARDNLSEAMEALKTDLLVVTNFKAAKEFKTALVQMNTFIETAKPARTTAKTNAGEICSALKRMYTQIEAVAKDANGEFRKYSDDIQEIADAVNKTVTFTYNEAGALVSVTDPTYGKDADGEFPCNQYEYDNGNLVKITFAGGKTASYQYASPQNAPELCLLSAATDTDGYTVEFTYTSEGRVERVLEKHTNTQGQQYTISYSTSDSTTFRFAGVDDIFDNEDDILNHYVFDEQGRCICVYSTDANGTTIIGAKANTYESDAEDSAKRYKIKDSAVVGMHTNNLLQNHSFEYDDDSWKTYKDGSLLPEIGAITRRYTPKHYLGNAGCCIHMTKRTGSTAGLKQSKNLPADTYTFSAYCKTENLTKTSAYLKVKTADGNSYTSDTITQITPEEFDNGWERLDVTFTLDTAQTVELCLETETSGNATGLVIFDCAQLETGKVANDYNILEDGSFEMTSETLPYKWTNTDKLSGHTKAERIQKNINNSVNPVDGDYCYHIFGQPTKDKYLRVNPNVGSGKRGYVLSGWVKVKSTPIRGERALRVKMSNEYEDTDGTTVQNIANLKINAFNTEWQYFCLPIYAANWKGATLTFYYCDSIGDVYLDGLELTTNDVTSRKYNADGKLTSYSSNLKSDTYSYDSYNRVKSQKTAAGALISYHYDKNNEVTYTSASIGPNVYYTYDQYGNVISTSSYDPDATTKQELYATTTYDENGNFVTSATDNDGNVTQSTYIERTGQVNTTIMPVRDVVNVQDIDTLEFTNNNYAVQTSYSYDYNHDDRLVSVSQEGRTVSYRYGEFGDLKGITHNGFDYEFEYDDFGNILSTSIAGNKICINEYADNNGSLTASYKGEKIEENKFSKTYDSYGNVLSELLGGRTRVSYLYDNKGEMIQATDYVANQLHQYDYNAAGKITKSIIYAGKNPSKENLESRMQIGYTKSGKIGSVFYEEAGEPIRGYSYSYATDEKPTSSILPDKSSITFSYDSLRRNNKTVFVPKSGVADSKKLYTSKTYKNSNISSKMTTALVEKYTHRFGKSGAEQSSYEYKYDSWGNILKIVDVQQNTGASDKGTQKEYRYNEYSEITKATEQYHNGEKYTYFYQYDLGGNITTEVVENETTGEIIRHTYKYASDWKDKLLSYDGKQIDYDQFGNPTSYMGDVLTWNKDGTLVSIIGGGDSTSTLAKNDTVHYTYLVDGTRHTKSWKDKTTTYHYNNGILLSETTVDVNATNPDETKETIRYYYSDGKVQSLTYQKGNALENTYFFTYNGQGDVTAIYRSSDSMLIGTYEYDLWGKLVGITEATKGIDKDCILEKNPIRYRGYYFDNETGFYYLNTRYYDASIRRFISADSVNCLGVDGTVDGFNLYAYCDNNPVNKSDASGMLPKWAIVGLGVVAAAVAVGVTVATFGAAGPAAVGGLTAMAAYYGVSASVATAAATAAVVATGAAASMYAGDVAYSTVTGESPMLEYVFHGNAEAYEAGLLLTDMATMGVLETARIYSIRPAPESQNEGKTSENLLENIEYTDKVKKQMKLGDYHSFPDSVNAFGSDGQVTYIVGGDNVTRIKIEISGSYMGIDGVFQYIIEPDGVTCNHRMFVPNR